MSIKPIFNWRLTHKRRAHLPSNDSQALLEVCVSLSTTLPSGKSSGRWALVDRVPGTGSSYQCSSQLNWTRLVVRIADRWKCDSRDLLPTIGKRLTHLNHLNHLTHCEPLSPLALTEPHIMESESESPTHVTAGALPVWPSFVPSLGGDRTPLESVSQQWSHSSRSDIKEERLTSHDSRVPHRPESEHWDLSLADNRLILIAVLPGIHSFNGIWYLILDF